MLNWLQEDARAESKLGERPAVRRHSASRNWAREGGGFAPKISDPSQVLSGSVARVCYGATRQSRRLAASSSSLASESPSQIPRVSIRNLVCLCIVAGSSVLLNRVKPPPARPAYAPKSILYLPLAESSCLRLCVFVERICFYQDADRKPRPELNEWTYTKPTLNSELPLRVPRSHHLRTGPVKQIEPLLQPHHNAPLWVFSALSSSTRLHRPCTSRHAD